MSLATTGLQRARYIATIQHTITRTVTPPSVPTHLKMTSNLNIYMREDVGEEKPRFRLFENRTD